MSRLIFIDGTLPRRTYELRSPRITVGRSAHNDLAFRDRTLSREHCEILVYGPEVIVRDLGSRNGTLVAGHLLNSGQRQLKHDQTLQFGLVTARLELDAPEESSADSHRLRRFSCYDHPNSNSLLIREDNTREPLETDSETSEETLALLRRTHLSADGLPKSVRERHSESRWGMLALLLLCCWIIAMIVALSRIFATSLRVLPTLIGY